MDLRFRGFTGSMSGMNLANHPVLVDQNFADMPRFDNPMVNPDFGNLGHVEPNQTPSSSVPSSCATHEDDSPEDCDLSDVVLRYINQMLMEEEMDDQACMLQDSLDVEAAERSFYEVLGKSYPPSPELYVNNFYHHNFRDDNSFRNDLNYANGGADPNSYLADSSWISSIVTGELSTSEEQSLPLYNASQSSFSSSNSLMNGLDGLVDSPDSVFHAPDFGRESQSVWQFNKGVEEASKFLPTNNDLFVNFEPNGLLCLDPKEGIRKTLVKVESTDDEDYSQSVSRGKKNPHRESEDFEEDRSRKQAAIYSESDVKIEMFDEVLLCNAVKGMCTLSNICEPLEKVTGSGPQPNGHTKASNGGKGRGKKQNRKKEVVDMRTILIHCAQAVAADDRRSATELLKQIRQHASPFGDGNQRLADCFAGGLEARLAGTGSQIYKGLVSKKTSAADILKAYHLYLKTCPFRKLSNLFSNRTIINVAANSTRLHIIDFGILYGFQWPTFIQRLSSRPGGPPKLRITGIDFPQPGFRPAERIEETGRRLADYAKRFNVPFEYKAIAKKWESIQLEELKIDREETIVVNSIYRFKNLLDESVAVDSSRNIVLNLIRKIKPDIFILGAVSGAYNAPFFVTRFREALFHFSAMFDMLETNVPREHPERVLIEREIFGKEALNVIACEGSERVERPETYKQWQVRQIRAGFRQLPLDREMMRIALKRVKSSYHKDFVIDEDGHWFLQGWKGRTIHALSCWKPV